MTLRPEVRTSAHGKAFNVKEGEIIQIKGTPEGESKEGLLFVNYTHFVTDVPVGQRILIDDGDIALLIVDKRADALLCQVENSGVIKLRKGVNVPNIKLNLPTLSTKDKAYIDFAITHKVDYIAHSFVQSAEDVHQIRNILDKHKSTIRIIAKIENQIGVDHIDEIIEASDGIMVARGDLGIEIAAEKISLYKRIAKSAFEE